jgi:hypothetical protein
VNTAILLVVVAAVVLVALVAAVAILRRRSRAGMRSQLPPQSGSAETAGGFVCPFCKRTYDLARSGRRCPSCGAAAPRER